MERMRGTCVAPPFPLASTYGDHDIDCRIDGVGAMQRKSEFVKRSKRHTLTLLAVTPCTA